MKKMITTWSLNQSVFESWQHVTSVFPWSWERKLAKAERRPVGSGASSSKKPLAIR